MKVGFLFFWNGSCIFKNHKSLSLIYEKAICAFNFFW